MQTITHHAADATQRSASLVSPTLGALLLLALLGGSPALAKAQSRSAGEWALLAKFDAVSDGARAELNPTQSFSGSDVRLPSPEQALLGRSGVENVSGVRASGADQHQPATAAPHYPTAQQALLGTRPSAQSVIAELNAPKKGT